MIDLNCDMGESFGAFSVGADATLVDYVTSVNIACGYHAGDPLVIDRTVAMAGAKNLCIGAHPSFPDLMGFGRRPMTLTPEETENYVLYQIGAVAGFAVSHGRKLTHVKPHGSLYNMAAEREEIARSVVAGAARYSQELIIVGPPNSPLETVANRLGLRFAREGFVDRAYNDDGSLVSRSVPGSSILDSETAAQQAVRIAAKGTVNTITGASINLKVDTLCIHGDSPSAREIAKAVRAGLEKADIKISSLRSLL